MVLLVIGIIVALVFKVKTDQKNSVEASKERYQQMISQKQIMTLTNDILEEDFTEYVKGSQRAKDLLHLLLACFGAFIGLFVIWMLIGAVFSVIQRKGVMSVLGHIFMALLFAGMFVGGYVIVTEKILPDINKEDPTTEVHYFEEIRVVGVQKDTVEEKKFSDDEGGSETKVYYYLITEAGTRIRVKEEIFDRYGEPGIYYAGKTEHTIFSLYEGKYFKLIGNP